MLQLSLSFSINASKIKQILMFKKVQFIKIKIIEIRNCTDLCFRYSLDNVEHSFNSFNMACGHI